MLTKEDLIELELPIAARNRIIAFQRYYAADADAVTEDFDIEELMRLASRSEQGTPHLTKHGTSLNNTTGRILLN